MFRPIYLRELSANRTFLFKNVNRLIPDTSVLNGFAEKVKLDKAKSLFPHLGMLIHRFGVREDFKLMVGLKDGVENNAYKHLCFMTDPNIQEVLNEQLTPPDNDEEVDRSVYIGYWFSFLYSFYLDSWFNPDHLGRIITYSPLSFDPSTVMMKGLDCKGVQRILENDVVDFFNKSNINPNFKESLTIANKIVERYHHYGPGADFFSSLKFYHFLPDALVFDVITKYLAVNDKENMKIAANLIAIYSPKYSLKETLETFN